MASTLYTSFRDEIVPALLAEFGRPHTFRSVARTYTVETGKVAEGAATDLTVSAIRLPKRPGGGITGFLEEELARFEAVIMVEARPFFVASVEPALGDLLIVGSTTYTITAIVEVQPGEEVIIYKFGVNLG